MNNGEFSNLLSIQQISNENEQNNRIKKKNYLITKKVKCVFRQLKQIYVNVCANDDAIQIVCTIFLLFFYF